MTSASNGLAATGVQTCQLTGQRLGLRYTARIVALPADRVSWRTPAGIKRARVGGSTHASRSVRTVSTPLAAQASW